MSVPKRTSVALKLPQLQNLIKRDPVAYREEFEQQRRHFESELEIFKLRPTADSERFTDLVSFMSQVVSSYKSVPDGPAYTLPTALLELLEHNGAQLHPDVRAKLLWAVIHLRGKNLIEPLVLLKLAFRLLAIPDKALRTSISEYVFSDIKSINLNKHNDKLNKRVQAMLFALVEEDTGVVARKTVSILSELYRRRVWTDARTVNVLATACVSSSIQVAVPAINFFLGIEAKMLEDEEEEKKVDNKKGEDVDRAHQHSKKTKKRLRQVEKAKDAIEKKKRELEAKASNAVPVFPAIQLIHDPQGLAERLAQRARSSSERFEVKLLIMNFVSRLIGCHRLILLPFYSFLQRYLTSHQIEVTRILTYLVQSCHELVPPEELMPVVRTIAHNFITERCTNEQMAVGLNAVREVMARVPSILREEGMGDLVQDLVLYGRKQHKSVMIAAHAVINLVRQVYPTLLRAKDRGKFYNPAAVPSGYGALRTATGVDGAELLLEYERGNIEIDSDGEVVWKDDQVEDDSEDSSSGSEDGDEAPQLVQVDSGDDDEEGDDEEEEGEWVSVSGDDEEEEGEWEEVGEDDEEEDGDEEEEDGDEEADEDDEEEEGGEDEEEDEGEWEMMDEPQPQNKKRKTVRFDTGNHSKKAKSNSGEARKTSGSPLDRVDATRVLSDSDFDLIRRLKAAQAEREKDPRYRTKRAQAQQRAANENATSTVNVEVWPEAPEDDDNEDGPHMPSYVLEPKALGAQARTGKMHKLDRLRTVVESRKESKWEHEGHAGGLTNKEKLRTKNFVMVRKGKASVRGKVNKSNSAKRYEALHGKKEQFGRDKRKRRRT